ncbi:unnamed protein product [Dicrocoelium dendriticum]|nr:unnamed protein product [Dicrocoelium dendriticum]
MSTRSCYMFCTLFHPIHGVDDDLTSFCQKFEATGSIRFTKFAELWRSEKFFHIVYGRRNQVGLSDVLGCLFYRLVDLIQPKPERSHSIRVCALYLLYALHGKQYIKNNVRIRVCPETWPAFLQLSQEAKDDGHLDVYYVFKQLCGANAFTFCLNRQILYPGVPLFNSPRLIPASSDGLRSADPVSLYMQFLKPPTSNHPDITEAINCLEQGIIQYTEAKSSLSAVKHTQDESTTSLSTEEGGDKKQDEFLPGLNFITYPNSLTKLFSIVDRMGAHEAEERRAGCFILERAESDHDKASGQSSNDFRVTGSRNVRSKHVLKQCMSTDPTETQKAPVSRTRDSRLKSRALGARWKRLQRSSTCPTGLEQQAVSVGTHVRRHSCRRQVAQSKNV